MKLLKLYFTSVFIVLTAITTNLYAQSEQSQDFPKWGSAMEVGYGFINRDTYACKVTCGVSYFDTKRFYALAQIGYNSFNYASDRDSQITSKTELHFVTLPIEVGYKLTKDNWGVIPFAGFGFNIGVKGKSKYGSYSSNAKIGGKIGVETRIGLKVLLGELTISGSYHLPLNSKQESFFGEDAYPEISIGFFM